MTLFKTVKLASSHGGLPKGSELTVVVTADEDSGFVVECAALPGCISQGDTVEEALANIHDAIAVCLATSDAEVSLAPHEPFDPFIGRTVISSPGAAIEVTVLSLSDTTKANLTLDERTRPAEDIFPRSCAKPGQDGEA